MNNSQYFINSKFCGEMILTATNSFINISEYDM
jgi:hypothetical protein